MPLFILLLTIPLIEIGLFVVIGGEIGLWPTLIVVLVTAIAGATAIRSQGQSALRDMNRLDDPKKATAAMMDGLFIVVAGLLLLTPGFLTDAIGLTLLIPPARAWIAGRISRNMQSAAASSGFGGGFFRVATFRAGRAPSGGPAPRTAAQDAAASASEPASDGPRRPIGKPDAGADDAVILDQNDGRER